MDPATILALLNAGLTLVEQLTPEVQALATKGEISVADQQALADRTAKLRILVNTAGPLVNDGM